MNPEELKRRTKEFALRVIRLVETMPPTTPGKVIGSQLMRSATSVAANYRAACRARTRAEFIAKIGVVIEEADETAFWLELAAEAGVVKGEQIGALSKEADEIIRIMVSSRKTSRQRQG